MFSNRFWPKRKSFLDNKKNISLKNHNEIAEEDLKRNKKPKKIDKNPNFLTKLIRTSFVKAKSFDQTQSSKKAISNDTLSSRERIKSLKINNKVSFSRIFRTKRSKSMSISSNLDVNSKNNSKEALNLSGFSSRLSSENTLENDDRKLNSSNIIKNNSKISENSVSFCGIVNHGNTCYINSVLQCINSIDSLAKYFVLNKFQDDLNRLNRLSITPENGSCKRKETISFLFSFALFLKSLWMPNLKCDLIASEFKSKLAIVDRNFHSNDQQDAQEFLLFLLNYCHEMLKSPSASLDIHDRKLNNNLDVKYNINYEAKKIADQNASKIHKLFATYQQLTITCPGCSIRQYKLEPHLCLSLPVPAKSMEPLYYCFVEKDGSQICAAMWINTVSLVQYVRANIAHKFRIDMNNVLIMVITETGFGKCYQDNESALELLAIDSTSQSTTNNIWSGIVAMEISSVMNNSSCNEYDSLDSQAYQTSSSSIKQMKNNTLPICKSSTYSNNDSRRQSGIYDNLPMTEQNPVENTIIQEEIHLKKQYSRHQNSETCQSNTKYENGNYSNYSFSNSLSKLNLIIIHVEELIENSFISGWRRFSAPVALLVHKEIEFLDLEKLILSQLETVYHCNIQSKLKLHLRFWVWDGLNNTDLEITNDHQFPLLTESVESIISWSENSCTIRIVAVWSPANASRLLQTIFSNVRLSHSLGRDVSKTNMYNAKSKSPNLTLIDAWSPIEENGSVELVMRASLSRRTENSESRNISLEDCLKAYLSEEILDAKDAWKCPNCHTFQRASMSTSIYSLPEILILHLKRFQSYSLMPSFTNGKSFREHADISLSTVGGNNSHNKSGSLFYENNSNNKLNILVNYPLSGLDMRPYLSKAAEIEMKKQSPKKSNSADFFYDLISVCNHQGTLSTGHYTAFCRSSVDYKWRLFNDEIVRELTADKVIQPNAYILFYQRRSSITSLEQHWSAQLEFSRNSNDSHLVHATSKSATNGNISQINNINFLQRKSDPPKRRIPYQTKRSSMTKINDQSYSSQHSNLRRPLPLDNNCNSLSNNTPILHDEDENENESTNSSTSNENFIPTSVTVRPLRLKTNYSDINSLKISQRRI